MKENKQINKAGLAIISSKELEVKLWAYETINKQEDQKPVKFLTKLHYQENYNSGLKKKLVINKESSSPPELASGRSKQGENTPQGPRQLCSDKGWWPKRSLPENGTGLWEEWTREFLPESRTGARQGTSPQWARTFHNGPVSAVSSTPLVNGSACWGVCCLCSTLYTGWEGGGRKIPCLLVHCFTGSQWATPTLNCSNSRNLGWMRGEEKWGWSEYKKGVHRLQASRGQTVAPKTSCPPSHAALLVYGAVTGRWLSSKGLHFPAPPLHLNMFPLFPKERAQMRLLSAWGFQKWVFPSPPCSSPSASWKQKALRSQAMEEPKDGKRLAPWTTTWKPSPATQEHPKWTMTWERDKLLLLLNLHCVEPLYFGTVYVKN